MPRLTLVCVAVAAWLAGEALGQAKAPTCLGHDHCADKAVCVTEDPTDAPR